MSEALPVYMPSEAFVKNAHVSGMDAYNALCAEAMKQGAAKLAAIGLQPVADVATPAQVTAFVRADIARLGPVLRAAGIQPE